MLGGRGSAGADSARRDGHQEGRCSRHRSVGDLNKDPPPSSSIDGTRCSRGSSRSDHKCCLIVCLAVPARATRCCSAADRKVEYVP